jgi:hypothetical protein
MRLIDYIFMNKFVNFSLNLANNKYQDLERFSYFLNEIF